MKLQADVCNFIEKENVAEVFFCEDCEISQKIYSFRTTPVAASKEAQKDSLTLRTKVYRFSKKDYLDSQLSLSLSLFLSLSLSLSLYFFTIGNYNKKIPREAVAQRCSVKRVILEIVQNSQENTCARVSFSIKLQTPATLLKRRLWHRCLPANFAKLLRTFFFHRSPTVAASVP